MSGPAPVYRTFQPGDETAFRELNEVWVRRYFAIEPRDQEILEDPAKAILEPGGEILIAAIEGQVVGTCALVAMNGGCFEISKMTVSDAHTNRGIGRKLLQSAIEHAKRIGAAKLYLETNHQLTNAIHLYESVGFTHVPPELVHPSPYTRADVYMEMMLR